MAGIAQACLAFIAHCDQTKQYPEWMPSVFSRHPLHDCARNNCGPTAFTAETDSKVCYEFCMTSGQIHVCGTEKDCCYATVSPDLDSVFCSLTGRVLSKHVMPATEAQWDERLDKKKLTQLGTESGDAKHDTYDGQGRKRKRDTDSSNSNSNSVRVWTFHDLQWTGRRFPALAKDDGDTLVRDAMQTICTKLLKNVPENTLATAADIAARLRLIAIHSKPYEMHNAFLSADKICLFVLYEIMKKGKSDPPFYQTRSPDTFVLRHLPPLLDLPNCQLVCSSTNKQIRAPDITKTRAIVDKCMLYWVQLKGGAPEGLLKKKWTPFEIESVANTTK